MLQIIGWMGCVYLIVKAFEIAGRGDSYEPHADNPEKLAMRSGAHIAMWIAGVGALIFALWLWSHGREADVLTNYDSSYSEVVPTTDCADFMADASIDGC